MSRIHATFEKLSRIPFGTRLASMAVTFTAPYFSTIRPVITDLRPGTCTIVMKDRRAVQNHLKTVHAIAMCNLCELTMGMALHPSLPGHLRWIPRAMSVRYVKKARGTLTGRCTVDMDGISPGDIDIPVSVTNEAGECVMDAVITVLISEKKAA
jgi:acyl-coenzyme A thioesterase PaaI-like protein